MGSLMAGSGWNSHVRYIQYERNRSLTKEEISRFRRSKKTEEEELFFLKASYTLSKEDKRDGSERLPSSLLVKEEESTQPVLKHHGWWICSKWAFLNQPPNMSWEPSYDYAAEFHVARKHICEP